LPLPGCRPDWPDELSFLATYEIRPQIVMALAAADAAMQISMPKLYGRRISKDNSV